MRPLIDFIILLTLPLFIGFTAANDNSKRDKQYCNDRYEFCIDYPADLFTQKFESDNGDGVHILSAKEDMNIQAFGSYNIMQWTTEDIYFFHVENLQGDYQIVKELSRNIYDDTYEAFYRVDDELRYYKSLLQNDSYVTLIIVVPLGMEELLRSLKNEVQLTVHL